MRFKNHSCGLSLNYMFGVLGVGVFSFISFSFSLLCFVLLLGFWGEIPEYLCLFVKAFTFAKGN